jgi:hypothetical protein
MCVYCSIVKQWVVVMCMLHNPLIMLHVHHQRLWSVLIYLFFFFFRRWVVVSSDMTNYATLMVVGDWLDQIRSTVTNSGWIVEPYVDKDPNPPVFTLRSFPIQSHLIVIVVLYNSPNILNHGVK